METYFIIGDKDLSIVKTYFDRREELKEHCKLSKNAIWHDCYDNFAIFGLQLDSEENEPLLDEFDVALGLALICKYGGAYKEFCTFCTANYKYLGTKYLERRIKF